MTNNDPMTTGSTRQPIAVFDLDGTCVNGQSGTLISLWLLRHGYLSARASFGLMWWGIRYKLHLPYRQERSRELIFSCLGKYSPEEIDQIMVEFHNEVMVPRYRRGAVEQIGRLKEMGCDIVQGYYFSKPVPPEEFDRFIIERSEIKEEATPTVKKTYMSISKALTSDFESIFYVDVVTAFYLEFFMGKNGDLEIRPAGTDFFAEARAKLLEDVSEADAERVREATGKTNMIRLAEQEEALALSFSKMTNGTEVPYSLQTIKTRESDHHHIVIGIRQE